MQLIYPFIHLYSKTTTENRYSTNLTYPDHKYNGRLVSRYEEVFWLAGVVGRMFAIATA